MTEVVGTMVGAGRIAVIYGRVPESREHDQTSLEEQLAACRTLAGELGYDVT